MFIYHCSCNNVTTATAVILSGSNPERTQRVKVGAAPALVHVNSSSTYSLWAGKSQQRCAAALIISAFNITHHSLHHALIVVICFERSPGNIMQPFCCFFVGSWELGPQEEITDKTMLSLDFHFDFSCDVMAQSYFHPEKWENDYRWNVCTCTITRMTTIRKVKLTFHLEHCNTYMFPIAECVPLCTTDTMFLLSLVVAAGLQWINSL